MILVEKYYYDCCGKTYLYDFSEKMCFYSFCRKRLFLVLAENSILLFWEGWGGEGGEILQLWEMA